MRVHVTGQICKRRGDFWLPGIAHIENECAAGVVIVGEQHAARWHHVFSVMHAYGLLVRSQSRYHMTVVGRSRICIDDDQKVVALASSVARPYQEIVRFCGCLLLASAGREKDTAYTEGDECPRPGRGCCHHSTAPDTCPWNIVVETDSA